MLACLTDILTLTLIRFLFLHLTLGSRLHISPHFLLQQVDLLPPDFFGSLEGAASEMPCLRGYGCAAAGYGWLAAAPLLLRVDLII